MFSQSISRSTALSVSIRWVRALPKWRGIGADCGSWPSPISRWPSFRLMSSSRGGGCHMAKGKYIALTAFVLAGVVGSYLLWRAETVTPLVGVVRTTEIRVAPEVGGQLATIKVEPGARVGAGDVVAEL